MAVTLAEYAKLLSGPQEFAGTVWRPHTEHGWSDEGRFEYTPLGTCPDCVGADMQGHQHLIEKPLYRGSPPGIVARGTLEDLLQQASLMAQLPDLYPRS